MPASDYYATVDGAVARTPVDDSDINDQSFVTKSMVQRWLDEASDDADAYVIRILEKTASSITDQTRRQLARMIERKAALEIMARFGQRGTDQYVALNEQIEADDQKLHNRAAYLNDAPADEVISNATDYDSRPLALEQEFSGDTYEF